MKLTRRHQTQTYQNSPACSVIEYPMDETRINLAIVDLNGRYPEFGAALNQESTELAYVVNGSGSVTINGIETPLAEGDAVLIEPNESFFWQGTMTLVMPCAPAWRPDQYQVVEN